MNDYKSAAAYDLTLFDPMRNRFTSVTVRQRAKDSSAAKLKRQAILNLFLAVVISAMCTVWIGSCTVYNELTATLGDSKAEYLTLISENEKLETAFSEKYDMRMIEDYAVNQLGMSRIDNNSITYINSMSEDSCRVISKEGGFAVSLMKKIFK